jgi:predicted glycosyl hydrolase (DUF1957 family)
VRLVAVGVFLAVLGHASYEGIAFIEQLLRLAVGAVG